MVPRGVDEGKFSCSKDCCDFVLYRQVVLVSMLKSLNGAVMNSGSIFRGQMSNYAISDDGDDVD